jgi:hypothetical protein
MEGMSPVEVAALLRKVSWSLDVSLCGWSLASGDERFHLLIIKSVHGFYSHKFKPLSFVGIPF